MRKFATEAKIGMPEVGIFDGEPNAFATGAFKNSALVAVSTGLLHGMTRDEVEAVVGHEVAHVANGDMVTMTLIQGVMNTFVVFLSRVIGYFVDKVVLRNDFGETLARGRNEQVRVDAGAWWVRFVAPTREYRLALSFGSSRKSVTDVRRRSATLI